MAKYTVKHSCGHETEYKLFGRLAERYRKLEWLETQPCFDCRRKAEEAEALKIIEGMELPELKGTSKQIAWANTIRAQYIKARRDEYAMTDFEILKDLASRTSAKEWIEHRKFRLL